MLRRRRLSRRPSRRSRRRLLPRGTPPAPTTPRRLPPPAAALLVREAYGATVPVQEIPDADDEGGQDDCDNDADLDIRVAGGVTGELAFLERSREWPGEEGGGRVPP